MAHKEALTAIGEVKEQAAKLFAQFNDAASAMSIDSCGQPVSDARAGVQIPDFIIVREVSVKSPNSTISRIDLPILVIEVKRSKDPGRLRKDYAQLQGYIDRLEKNCMVKYPIPGILLWAQDGTATQMLGDESRVEAEVGDEVFFGWLKETYDLAMNITEPIQAREDFVTDN